MRRKPPNERDLVDNLDDNDEADDDYETPNVDLAQPENDIRYEILPDRVVALDKRRYTRQEAYTRFAEIANSQGLLIIPGGYRETARHYCFEVLYEKRP